MQVTRSRLVRGVGLLVAACLVASCSLPRVGPSKREIFAGSVQREGDAFVVEVDDRVTRATAVVPALGFGDAFVTAGVIGGDTISPGDTLGFTIWESVDDGLIAADAANAATLEEVRVDSSGFIFLPYAGRIRAAGNSPEAVRRIVTDRLSSQTPDPQVVVRRLAGEGQTVSVLGAVGDQGVYPIERPARTLSAMLARAGGVATDPDAAQVTVQRGGHSGAIWVSDLYDDPRTDIALRGGDKILVEADRRSFTALGATGTQARVGFDSRTISAVEALAQVGGLVATASDPTGVFVFRNEPQEIANEVLGRDDLVGAQRMVYVLDLTRPNGMFTARDFVIRDQDTVYVTEAAATQWSRVISTVTGTLGTAATAGGVGN